MVIGDDKIAQHPTHKGGMKEDAEGLETGGYGDMAGVALPVVDHQITGGTDREFSPSHLINFFSAECALDRKGPLARTGVVMHARNKRGDIPPAHLRTEEIEVAFDSLLG